jgi:membrane-bound metal-dependent hydrolase YbcI (DUF457 family)
MDTLTHGIVGALIGKAFFAPEPSSDSVSAGLGRTAILGATLGAIFPDIDYFYTRFLPGEFAFVQYHRYITHSFLCLPLFAVLVALAVYAFARGRGWRSPSFGVLTAICGVGIASHIFFDLITTYGTMIWSPWSNSRPAWDLVFILDFTFTGIVLVPQVLVWIYHTPQGKALHGWGLDFGMWLLFTALAEFILWLAPKIYFSHSPMLVALAPVVLATVFFLPQWRGFGYRVRRSTWCRAGVCALTAYLLLCVGAHALAERRVRKFAVTRGLQVEVLGALPVPPSANYWDGLIRTPSGVYETQFALLDSLGVAAPPDFRFHPDSAPDRWIEAARQLPEWKTAMWFARFPVVQSFPRGTDHVVTVDDLRFLLRPSGPPVFQFHVTFDAEGRVVYTGYRRTAR